MSSGRQPARIAIASVYPSVRAGLRAMLAPLDSVEVVVDLIDDDLVVPEALDLIVLDVEPDDPARVARLAERYPGAALVLLVEEPVVRQLVGRDDGRGLAILARDAGPDDLALAVLGALRGLIILDPEVAGLDSPRPAPEPDETLTDREREVLALVALGLANKAIAVELGISEHTVKFHVAAILAKLDAASRTEAVTTAARRGWLVL